jgi:hypothetical protein
MKTCAPCHGKNPPQGLQQTLDLFVSREERILEALELERPSTSRHTCPYRDDTGSSRGDRTQSLAATGDTEGRMSNAPSPETFKGNKNAARHARPEGARLISRRARRFRTGKLTELVLPL